MYHNITTVIIHLKQIQINITIIKLREINRYIDISPIHICFMPKNYSLIKNAKLYTVHNISDKCSCKMCLVNEPRILIYQNLENIVCLCAVASMTINMF